MPSIITHAAVPLMLGAAAGRRRISGRLLLAGAVAAMLPDLDVAAFKLGIRYQDVFGHRGATHSIVFALALAISAALAHRWLNTSAWRSAIFVGLAALSHPLLDACTNGGMGVALLWPFSEHRWFFPFRPIAVSPLGVSRFMGSRGLTGMASELCWVWLATALFSLTFLLGRRSVEESNSNEEP
ncbi:metal-dependent hydrolase [Ralstonia sp. 25C]|uniref:metal-dependent hydrolase n=1 Tax=Ralstonia sp. 25C TaxID=3447363 RepID=UPI003F7550D4